MKANKGFTLIELLIALAITGILGVAITSLYINNLRVNTAQTTVVRVQQNIRATADYITRQIRMAGYIGNNPGTAGITTATEGRFQFTSYDEDAGALNDIDFKLSDDADEDGIIDGGIANNSGTNLTAQFGGAGGYQPLAENIHAIAFAYAISDGIDIRTYTTTGGEQAILWVTPDPAGGGNWMRLDANGDGVIAADDDALSDGELDLVDTGILLNLNMIRAVRFSLLGTAHREAQEYTNQETYIVGRHVLTPNDTIRRRLITTIATCRNMGL